MRVVVDALAALDRSHSFVVEQLLRGWVELGTGDELHLAITPQSELAVPPSVRTHVMTVRRPARAHRVLLQSTALPRLCRSVRADGLLATLPASAMVPAGCPRTSFVFDFRHELRPEQFSRQHLALRRVSYGAGYRLSDSLVCASERSRADLLRLHPRLADEPVSVALLGADHALAWRATAGEPEPYALAFGQWNNKNPEAVVRAWALLGDRPDLPRLHLIGMNDADRARIGGLVADLGVGDRVDLLPWLSTAQFEATFAAASMVVFPSDFEGFGLPAPEAMLLGRPLVVSRDPALLEVTGGLATVAAGTDPASLADAVVRALATTPAELAAGQEWARAFTWRRTAQGVREALQVASARRRR